MRATTAAKLDPIAAPDAEDVELLGQVVGYYARQLIGSGEAQVCLHRRKLPIPRPSRRSRSGSLNRSVGYRLPNAQTNDCAALRSRLRALGVLRSSGHEHLRGCLTVPVLDERRVVGEIYGCRVQPLDPRTATSSHLYLTGPHRGAFNIAAFASLDDLIVCEPLIDALTLWCAEFRHVTACYGAEGSTSRLGPRRGYSMP